MFDFHVLAFYNLLFYMFADEKTLILEDSWILDLMNTYQYIESESFSFFEKLKKQLVVVEHTINSSLLFIYNSTFINNCMSHINFNFWSEFLKHEYVQSFVWFQLFVLNCITYTYFLFVFFCFFFTIHIYILESTGLYNNDYFFSTVFIFSEKELGSIEDFLNCALFFFFVFGWYFYNFGLSLHDCFSVSFYLFSLLPVVYYCFFFIPVNLLTDFSVAFTAYLRGSAPSPFLLGECLFDSINSFAFFLRTFVQNVRFLIILFACHGVNEVITLHGFNSEIFIEQTVSWRHNFLTTYSLQQVESYLFFKLLNDLIYAVYELAHTMFILIIQFSAFLAMVFWLFSFLYTFFSTELLEHFLEIIRILFFRKKCIKGTHDNYRKK